MTKRAAAAAASCNLTTHNVTAAAQAAAISQTQPINRSEPASAGHVNMRMRCYSKLQLACDLHVSQKRVLYAHAAHRTQGVTDDGTGGIERDDMRMVLQFCTGGKKMKDARSVAVLHRGKDVRSAAILQRGNAQRGRLRA